MKMTYYRSEYTEKQWIALIDKAEELHLEVTYSKYGNATIDSTNLENAAMNGQENTRAAWASHIHDMLQRATDLRTWEVRPASRYRRGYCPTICKSFRSAEHERERLERETGFVWVVAVIPE